MSRVKKRYKILMKYVRELKRYLILNAKIEF